MELGRTAQPNAEYDFRLRVLCGDGVPPPPPSPCLSLCTPAAAPGAPGVVALAARTFNALKVNWSPPKDTGGVKIVQYTLRMAPVPAEHAGAVDAAGFGEVSLRCRRKSTCAVRLPSPGCVGG